MMFHIDKHSIVHEVVYEQDWTVEFYKKCDPGQRERQGVLWDREDLKVTCLACLGLRQ